MPFDWESQDRISNYGDGTLVFFETKSSDAGDYQCAATNKYGTSTSRVIHVKEIKIPSEYENFKPSDKVCISLLIIY